MTCPLDYSHCQQTVTVYRKEKNSIMRQVVEGCYLEYRDKLIGSLAGDQQERGFLLIMPGNIQRVFPGDRVLLGIGPRVTDWESFIPETVAGLVEVQYTKPCYWENVICHVEAGR